MWFSMTHQDYKTWDSKKMIDYMLDKNDARADYYDLLIKMIGICLVKKTRIIVENPYQGQQFLRTFLKQPDIVDSNRMLRGDYMVKPTAYWFFNCEPTHGYTHQLDKNRVEPMKLKKSGTKGLCSEERSMISPDYARNWICDFVIGKEQNLEQLAFDFS